MRQEEWHQYTLFKHALLTIKAVQPTPVLRLAALFHDVAKPRVRKKSGGRLRFPDHEEASARLAEEIMKRLRFSRRLTTQVTALVRNHRIENQGRLSDGDIRRILRRIGRENCDALLALHRANILARGLHNVHPNHLDELETRFRSISEEPFAVTSADLDVNGREAMEILGIQPGPELGRVLADLLEIVTDDPSMNTRERLTSVLVKRKGSGVG